ncbi:TPA: hypothetical protein ACTZ3H_005353 [Bacillus cereus]
MKKLFSFLLFVFVIFSANNISFADEVIPFNKSFFAYSEPKFTSAKGNGGIQYGPQKALTVKEKRSNGWWKIGTWEGDKWINADGELQAFDKPFLAFYEPSFSSQKGNMEIPYASNTTVRVIDGNTKGWLKFQSWEGDKWMYPGVAETVAVNNEFYTYSEPSLTSTKGSLYTPQKFLPVVEKRQDGWWKIVTANEGLKWVAPNGVRINIDVNFNTFDEPYLESAKHGVYAPQPIFAYDMTKTDQGDFYLVGTSLGKKWVSMNAEKEFNEKREPLRKALGYNENDIGPDKTPQQRVAEARAALKAQGLDDTYEAVRIPTEEEKAEFLRKEAEKQKNPKQGVARAGTVTSSWNIPDDWVQKGDIVITPDSNYGITGHSGIIGKDFTETQGFSGANKGEYLLVHAPGTSASPAIKIMPLSKWEFIHKGNQEYSNFVYLRYKKDKGAAFRAADYAYNHFYQNGSKYRYDIFGTSAKSNDYKTYCSKLVYLSFRDGAGVDFFPVSNFYIVHPYDFLRPMPAALGLRPYFFGKGGMWWG